MLQAQQINPVPYRPQMIGLVERFHRSWKDCVAIFMANDAQNDWNLWVKFAFTPSYHESAPFLQKAAANLDAQLADEGESAVSDDTSARSPVLAATVASSAAKARRTPKRHREATNRARSAIDAGERLVETRRRRIRNKAGQYELQYELWPLDFGREWTDVRGRVVAIGATGGGQNDASSGRIASGVDGRVGAIDERIDGVGMYDKRVERDGMDDDCDEEVGLDDERYLPDVEYELDGVKRTVPAETIYWQFPDVECSLDGAKWTVSTETLYW
ncbi:hypothetical protein PInf_009865 [Phytophthora infestans]|nr:hypothetical protein PInf_009865 [Phytophthora infestans]